MGKQSKLWLTERNIRRAEALGMSPGAARNILINGLLRELMVIKGAECFRCGDPITREDKFHLDHKMSWETSRDPRTAYFDLSNVAFSHAFCNLAVSGLNTKRLSPRERVTYREAKLEDLRRKFPKRRP